mmetsp:Transcript_47178/g.86589  ORF Transcript_47178/g.86589 Transcript_47178/m.86589 type:complete len:272 (-) Transcript_47178:150-965(-)
MLAASKPAMPKHQGSPMPAYAPVYAPPQGAAGGDWRTMSGAVPPGRAQEAQLGAPDAEGYISSNLWPMSNLFAQGAAGRMPPIAPPNTERLASSPHQQGHLKILGQDLASDTGFYPASPWPQDYDEELQEDIYLRLSEAGRETNEVGYPPVKNTFLHYDVQSSDGQVDARGIKWCSAPTVVMENSFHTKNSQRMKEMQILHANGECKPCAYFLYKSDGCRQGDECQFCHLCQRGEIKKRKKEKKRALRAAAAMEAGEGGDDLDCDSAPEDP